MNSVFSDPDYPINAKLTSAIGKTLVAGVKRSSQVLRQSKIETVIGTRLPKLRCPILSSLATCSCIGHDGHIQRCQITERDKSLVRGKQLGIDIAADDRGAFSQEQRRRTDDGVCQAS